jgi:uncharacterized Zn finger protein (UPF0148 family)
MSEKGAPQEECLYCHNSLVSGDLACPVCGDTGQAQAQEPEEVPVFNVKFDPEFLPAYP